MAEVSADLYVEVLRYYAQQMSLLDAQDIEAYVETFTEQGVTHHVHRGQKLEGRAAMLAHARQALPRYRGVVVRHWNDNYLMNEADDGSITVAYGSLVTLTEAEGIVRFESTYAVTDVLVRVDGRLRARSRTIVRDQPAAG
ncbi:MULTISPECIES: nuclear transport factor 2 family protein [Streptomyces]|uniref:Nuclear transport factor 2 family protein n=1 Tax=Streptomyces maoxianensis TaxID=1459942 RepID=A0ABV9GHK7_9ACTN|nr:nuclear transport factor 2 family protein [Streptomyces sp. ISL-1]MBT2388380.1 nuclear transport factor 2 family protein [Streptomyces sp. ISL-1]